MGGIVFTQLPHGEGVFFVAFCFAVPQLVLQCLAHCFVYCPFDCITQRANLSRCCRNAIARAAGDPPVIRCTVSIPRCFASKKVRALAYVCCAGFFCPLRDGFCCKDAAFVDFGEVVLKLVRVGDDDAVDREAILSVLLRIY